ncbi:MAG: kynureninase [Candidatus Heimdallarchaeota archaeon]|nr:kynureninase [Candidatus Heimdallarchaeota archaeon]
MSYQFEISESFAQTLDKQDSIAQFRDRFHIPKDTIYLDGNSLGLLSKDSQQAVLRVLDEWKTLGIRGWLEAEHPWFYYSEKLGEMLAPLVGAQADEVVATGTTTVNLHALVSTFYQPKESRTKILADELNFPTDIYALRSQIQLKGLDPQQQLILAPSSDGRTLDEETIVDLMAEDVALIVLPSVLYRSGQLLDMPYLTDEAHKRGILIGFDCSHSVGCVPHHFDDWGVDFAFWCSYKYLNSGPGAPAFLYVNEKHFTREPGIAGWFGYVKDKQFDMNLEFESARSAGGWQISSPGILGAAGIEGALKVTLDAGIQAIREKAKKITSFFVFLVDELLSEPPYNFQIGTPRDPEKRSGHIALEHPTEALRINEALKQHKVIPDFRPPNIIRIAPIALYNTYHEVWQVVQLLKQIIDKEEYKQFSKERKAIS